MRVQVLPREAISSARLVYVVGLLLTVLALLGFPQLMSAAFSNIGMIRLAQDTIQMGCTFVLLDPEPCMIDLGVASWLERSMAFEDDQVIARRNLAKLFAMRGEHEAASEVLQTLTAGKTTDSNTFLLAGTVHWALGNMSEANSLWKRIPGVERLFVGQGRAYFEAGDYTRAISNYDVASQLVSGWSEPYYQKGMVYQRLREWEKALAAFETSIAVDAYLHETRQLADSYSPSRAHFRVGQVLEAQGRWDEAITIFQEAVRLDPTNGEAHAELGWAIYRSTENVTEAKDVLRQAMATDHGRVAVYLRLSDLYRAIGDNQQAEHWAHEALAAAPDNVRALLDLGQVAFADGDYARAVQAFDKVVTVNAQGAEGHFWLGRSHTQLGHYASAIEELSRSVELAPDRGNYHYHLADAYRLAGRLEEALIEYERALEIAPENQGARSWVEKLKER